MTKLDTDHGPFVELVSQGRVYVVPAYQRAYSWKATKQVAELWGDILRLYVNAVDEGNDDTHFIGSVVTGSVVVKALGPVECPVIDGQQRLMTLALIVAAIRDQLVTDPQAQAEITSQYLAHFKNNKISAIRVRPGVADRDVFDAIIRQQDVSNRRSLVHKAYAYIVDRLLQGPTEDTDPDEQEEVTDKSDEYDDIEDEDDELDDEDVDGSDIEWDWEQLLSVIGTQLELVSIADVPPESSYQIFATLNSKGMPLSQVDLIRNAVFMLMPTSGARAHRELWQPMEDVMGKELLQSYLHTWVVRRGHNVPAKETYSSAVKELSRPGFKESDVRKQLKDLHAGAWAYLLITRPRANDRSQFDTSLSVPKSVITALSRLREWKNVPMEPVLLEVVERFKSKTLSTKQINALLSYLESFVVRRFIAQVPPNDLRSTFARLTQQIRKKTTAAAFEKALLDGLSEPLRRWPTDGELRDAMRRRPLYRQKGQRLTFLVLKRLAEAYEGKESPHIVPGKATDEYSIEHILPQSFPDRWRKDLAKWKDPNPQETWETLLDVSGNLTLTAYNSELSNLPFIGAAKKMGKRKWISDHLRLELSRTVLTKDKWTREEINNRSSALAEKAIVIWPPPTL